ncbi:MAG: heparan-alpha-glucosaminide N-acetyltransferase [Eubacteriales bacterium]
MLEGSSGRVWEIDIFRGIAIILMVFFHLIYDLAEFHGVPVVYDHGPVYFAGKTAASLFIMVAGISSTLSRNNVKRGLKLVFLGFLIFIVTSIFVPGSNIIFGILQFLGVSMLLYPLFKNFNAYLVVLLGTAVILSGPYLFRITMPNNWLAPIGLLSRTFYSADYFPLFPWFGVFLYGIAMGKLLYKEKRSLLKLNAGGSPLVYLGRHSLFIYLVHQPVLLLVLLAVFQLNTRNVPS